MKTTWKLLMMSALVAVIGAPLAADDKADQKKVMLPPGAKAIVDATDDLGLNEDQSGKIQEIQKQYAPKFKEQIQQQDSIYTPEQKEQRKTAAGKAKDQGLKGKEREQFIQSSVQFTPEQQKKYTDCQTQMLKVQQDFRQEIVEVLTPEQAEKIPQPGKGKKGKTPPGKPGKPGKEKPQQGGGGPGGPGGGGPGGPGGGGPGGPGGGGSGGPEVEVQ